MLELPPHRSNLSLHAVFHMLHTRTISAYGLTISAPVPSIMLQRCCSSFLFGWYRVVLFFFACVSISCSNLLMISMNYRSLFALDAKVCAHICKCFINDIYLASDFPFSKGLKFRSFDRWKPTEISFGFMHLIISPTSLSVSFCVCAWWKMTLIY